MLDKQVWQINYVVWERDGHRLLFILGVNWSWIIYNQILLSICDCWLLINIKIISMFRWKQRFFFFPIWIELIAKPTMRRWLRTTNKLTMKNVLWFRIQLFKWKAITYHYNLCNNSDCPVISSILMSLYFVIVVCQTKSENKIVLYKMMRIYDEHSISIQQQ